MDIKELVDTLTKGRDSAKKLQNLLSQKVDDDELASIGDLVTEISRSFYGSLLVLNSSNSGEHSKVPASSPCSSDQILPLLRESKKEKNDCFLTGTPFCAPAVKGRRGCYKRRKTIDSRIEVSDTIEDGHAWRKYGQKEILNSNFPRCYFRCTHKQSHGCKALKQVQKLEGGLNKFHIIYFGDHTCPPPTTSSHFGKLHIDCKSSKNHNFLPNSPTTVANNHMDPSIKQEDLSSKASSAQSSPDLAWKEILLDEFECYKNNGSFSDISFDDIVFS